MSSRALRRLQGNSDLPDFKSEDDDSDCENDGSFQGGKNKLPSSKSKSKAKKKMSAAVNPFELLDEPENEIMGNSEEDNNIDEVEIRKEELKGAKKKKKKKKKGKDKPSPDANNTVHNGDPIDEVEASLQEVNRILGDPGLASAAVEGGSSFSVNMKPLLHIDYRNLNPDTEMKRMFGSEMLRAERGEQSQRFRRQRNRPVLRSTKLVQVKDTWHGTGGSGLSMAFLGENKGFVFEHSSMYQKLQHRFLDGIESGYPEHIFNILQENPYHIDTLITLADFYHMNEDIQTGAECIEKALYGLECAFHSLFNLASGNSYLDYKRRENRSLFICIFKHIINLGRRGCNRTAFEFCKVLLGLDAIGDPLNCLSMIDFYALRSEQYDFLLRLEAEISVNASTRLETLQSPNFAFSVPLAHYRLAMQNDGDTTKADTMLQDKLLLYPMMLLPLLDKCSVNPDKRVSSHKFFTDSGVDDRTSELGRLVKLYVGRCETCWKDAAVMRWLERNVTEVLDIVDAGTDKRLQTYPSLRSKQFKHPPPSILRHYNLSGIAIPAHVSNRTVYSHDPYPPTDSIAGYDRPVKPTRAARDDQGMLSLLLSSLLPSYNPNELVDPASQRRQAQNQVPGFAMGAGLGGFDDGLGDDEGAAGIPQQLQTSVNAIMDAMRNLLNRAAVTPNEETEEGDLDEESERGWEEEEDHYQHDH